MPSTGSTAVRGHAVSFRADPFRSEDALVDVEDALVVCQDGLITAFGPYDATKDAVPPGVEVVHRPGSVLCPGFVDTHAHYVQTGIVGASGGRLIDWLNSYAFVEEQRFAQPDHARRVARVFFDELLRNGTTTALTFCAVFPDSVDAFFEESQRRGTRMVGGKVLMDRNAPDALLDTAESGYEDSKALIERWHGNGRQLYAVTPRFAPTSSPEQLDAASALWHEHPGTFLHTHVSETPDEVEWVGALFPRRAGYLDVYDDHGLLGPRCVLAHGVHLTSSELRRVSETGSAIAHCPTSNLFLGSGLFSVRRAKDAQHPVEVGLGTDVGAGTSFSMIATMGEAHKVARLLDGPLSPLEPLYLATLGGARALGLDDRIGSLEVGKEADFLVLDPAATPILALRTSMVDSTEELVSVLSMMSDDRAVAATYVGGTPVHERANS